MKSNLFITWTHKKNSLWNYGSTLEAIQASGKSHQRRAVQMFCSKWYSISWQVCQNMIRSEITNVRTVPLLSALRPLPLHLFTVSEIMISVPLPPTSGWNPEPMLLPSNCPGNFLGGFLCVVPLTACYDLYKPAQHPNPILSFHVGIQQMTHCGCYFMNYPTFICVLSCVTNSFVTL